MHSERVDACSTRLIFFFNDTATTEIYTLSLHDALPICAAACGSRGRGSCGRRSGWWRAGRAVRRSEEHTSELQSQSNLVCRLLLEKKRNYLGPLGPSTPPGCSATRLPARTPHPSTHLPS